MDRTPVSSSSIASIGYDEASRTLEVEFVSGSAYRYFGVPEQIHSELMAAPSKGGYFNAEIRERFPYAQLQQAGRRASLEHRCPSHRQPKA